MWGRRSSDGQGTVWAQESLEVLRTNKPGRSEDEKGWSEVNGGQCVGGESG